MAQLVNYKKRSFTLPPGCKNLIDVLERSRRQTLAHTATGGFPSLEIREERFPTAGLAQIGRYVSMLLLWQGELFTISITALELEFPLTLYRAGSEQTAAVVLVTKESHQQLAIRAFFERQGLDTIFDQTDADAPDSTRGLAYPLPPDAARAISLTTELLRRVYGLSDEAGLDFRYYEMETAA